MSLYVEDVDDLRDWWDDEREGDSSGSMLGRLDGVVAQIVARHAAEARAAALNEAADAIKACRSCAGLDVYADGCYIADAANAVRDLARPCRGQNSNVCVAEGCYGGTCLPPP